MTPRSRSEIETARRIRIAVYAYTYEFLNISLVDDFTFDRLCLEIDPTIDTTRPDLDFWFRTVFDPSTGSWIHKHPELNKIISIFWSRYAYNYTA